MRVRFLIVAALATAAASASAKPLPTEQFKAKSPVSIQSDRAYLLVRKAGIDLVLLRTPTEPEKLAYTAERAAALVKAKAKYVKQIKTYERELEHYKDSKRSGTAAVPPEKPIEPTEASFAYRAIESDKFVTIWGGRVFEGDAQFIAVPPGTYRIYGRIFTGANGSMGVCMCMGSLEFDAAAGTITDLGTLHHSPQPGVAVKEVPTWNGLTPGKGGLTSLAVIPATPNVSVPARLAGLSRAPAAYRASGKIDNFFGVMVDRITALPGVLAYERDTVVDVASGQRVVD